MAQTRAGELRHRVAFDARQDVEDIYGNTQSDFVEQFIVSAKVQPKFGGETVMAARLTGKQPVLIVVRQSSNTRLIRTEWRARDVRTNKIYNLLSEADPNDRREWLEILAEDLGEIYIVPPPPVGSAAMIFSLPANSGYLAILEDI